MKRRAFSLRDRLALIYTSAGSQRNVAALVGISHQKVGRILHGTYAPDSRALSDPGLIRAVDLAFSIHVDLCRSQAQADGLPFDPACPIFTTRLPMEIRHPITGELTSVPGLRVQVDHAHWLTDDMRRFSIDSIRRTRFYHNLSVGSYVNLKAYFQAGEREWRENNKRGKFRDPDKLRHRANLARKIRRGQQMGFIYTPMVPMDFPLEPIIFNVDNRLQQKHAPASADDNALFATRFLLQTKFRDDGSIGSVIPESIRKARRKARRTSGNKAPTKPRQARTNKGNASSARKRKA